MDTTAVSIGEIVKRKHELKWRDYYLLKHLIRMTVSSPNLQYSEVSELGVRLSMFTYREVVSKSIFISCYFDKSIGKYEFNCFIR